MAIELSTPAKLFKLPGGEWHITAERLLTGVQRAFVQDATADDLIALSIWVDAVRRDEGIPRAAIPYLPGARQDRRLPAEALSCRVYSNIINGMDLDRVVCLDPHSDAMPACLNRCRVIPLAPIVAASVRDTNIAGVIIPDAGARRRAVAVADLLRVPIYQAGKKRDMATGKLDGFTCEPLPSEGRMLVVDDICDGGGTFMGLASATGLPPERLSLWVTHGIFSGQAASLSNYYGHIFTTDSRTLPSAMAAAMGDRLHTTRVRDLLFAALT